MPPRPAKPEPEEALADRAAWRQFAARVRPLSGSTRPPVPSAPPAPAAPPTPKVPANSTRAPIPEPRAPLVIGEAPPGLDRASWRRFAAGQVRPALTLDLHGMTAARAVLALDGFLHRAAQEGHRTVEVITGRGSGPEGGVIRREFPHWLNGPALRPLLLGACHPHRANPGSVLLLLRRKR